MRRDLLELAGDPVEERVDLAGVAAGHQIAQPGAESDHLIGTRRFARIPQREYRRTQRCGIAARHRLARARQVRSRLEDERRRVVHTGSRRSDRRRRRGP